jgi:hypothetical protein
MALLSIQAIALASALLMQPSSDERFLETVRIVSARAREGEVVLATRDGARRTLREGDALEEEGATLKDVTSTTLVFTRLVTGAGGESGSALIVVRFDASGKTKVREYRTLGDVAPPRPPRS